MTREDPQDGLAVALDVTPLIGARSGVGHFVAEILDAMQSAPGMRLVPYSLSLRARAGGIPGLSRPAPGPSPLPAGTRLDPQPRPFAWTDYLLARPEYTGSVTRSKGPIAYYETSPANPKTSAVVPFAVLKAIEDIAGAAAWSFR